MAAICLIFVPDVSDGTFLKPAFLYLGAFVLLIAGLARSASPLSPGAMLRNVPTMLYLAATLVSLLNAHDILLGLERFCQIASCAVFYFWMQRPSATEEDRARTVSLVLLIGIATAAISLLHFIVPLSSSLGYVAGQLSAASTFGNKAYFGGFLATILPLAAGYAWNRWREGRGRMLSTLALAMLALALLQTGSRSSWIGAAAGCLLFLAITVRRRSRRLLVVVGIAAMVGIALLAAPSELRQRLSQLFETGPQSTVSRRIFFYEGALRASAASPFIGHGAGNFTVFLPRFRSPDYWAVQSEDIVPHAHDEFLEVLSESGLVGLISFGLVVALSLASAARRLRTEDSAARTVWAGLIASIVACLVDNLFNMSLRTVPVMLLLWMLMGLAAESPPQPVPEGTRRWRLVGAALISVLLAAATIWQVPHLARRYGAEKAFLHGMLARFALRSEEAQNDFSDAVTLAPRNMEARFFLAANLTESGKYREAALHLEDLLERRPYYPRARTLLAIGAAEAGDSARALSFIGEELQLESSPQAYYFGSHVAGRLGNAEMKARYLLLGLQQNVRSGMTDYLLEALDDLPSACQAARHYEECGTVMEDLEKKFAGHADVIRRLEEIRLEMRTG